MILVAVELLSSDPDRVSISEEPPRPAVLDGKPKNNYGVSDSTRSCFDVTCILHGMKINVCHCCKVVKNLCQYALTC